MDLGQLSLFCRNNIIPQELVFISEQGFMMKPTERSYYHFGGKIPDLHEVSYTDFKPSSTKTDKSELRLLMAVCNYLELLEKKNNAIPPIIIKNHHNYKLESDSWIKCLPLRYKELSTAKNLMFIKGGDPERYSHLETSKIAINLLQRLFYTKLNRSIKW